MNELTVVGPCHSSAVLFALYSADTSPKMDATFHVLMMSLLERVDYILKYSFSLILFTRPSRVGCAQAYKYYGRPGNIEHRKCDETRHPDICSFKETKSGNHRLLCNAEVCGSSNITIGSLNAAMGKVTDWIPTSKETITGTVQEAVETNQKNGFGFLYIKCGDILQSLIFPPILKEAENDSQRNNINVNVVVLDSVARPHFYRILPRSVEGTPQDCTRSRYQGDCVGF